MNKEKCESLYQEYLSLKVKVDYAFQVKDVVRDKPLEIRTAPSSEDMQRFNELKKLLKNDCKECLGLSPSELFKLEQ